MLHETVGDIPFHCTQPEWFREKFIHLEDHSRVRHAVQEASILGNLEELGLLGPPKDADLASLEADACAPRLSSSFLPDVLFLVGWNSCECSIQCVCFLM